MARIGLTEDNLRRSFRHLDLNKGKKTGVYLDTAENRKKGRVGRKYKKEVSHDRPDSEHKPDPKKDNPAGLKQGQSFFTETGHEVKVYRYDKAEEGYWGNDQSSPHKNLVWMGSNPKDNYSEKKAAPKEHMTEPKPVTVRDKISAASKGSKASGGGYGPFVNRGRNDWHNSKTNTNMHDDALFSHIGGFDDFKIKKGIEPVSSDELAEFEKAIDDDLIKAAKLPDGAKRKFGPNWYIKQGGKWVYLPSKSHEKHEVGKHHPDVKPGEKPTIEGLEADVTEMEGRGEDADSIKLGEDVEVAQKKLDKLKKKKKPKGLGGAMAGMADKAKKKIEGSYGKKEAKKEYRARQQEMEDEEEYEDMGDTGFGKRPRADKEARKKVYGDKEPTNAAPEKKGVSGFKSGDTVTINDDVNLVSFSDIKGKPLEVVSVKPAITISGGDDVTVKSTDGKEYEINADYISNASPEKKEGTNAPPEKKDVEGEIASLEELVHGMDHNDPKAQEIYAEIDKLQEKGGKAAEKKSAKFEESDWEALEKEYEDAGSSGHLPTTFRQQEAVKEKMRDFNSKNSKNKEWFKYKQKHQGLNFYFTRG